MLHEGFYNAPSRRSIWRIVQSHTELGVALHLVGRYREEVELGREARREFPPDLWVYAITMELRGAAGLGDTAAVERLVDELDRNTQGAAGVTVSRALVAAGELGGHGSEAKAAAMYARAARDLGRSMAAGDTTATALFELIAALQGVGRPEEVDRLLPRLLAQGDSLGYYYFRGWVAAKRGDQKSVSSVMNRLARMQLTNRIDQFYALYMAGCLAAITGDRSRAMELLRAAMQAGHGEPLVWHRDPDLASLRNTPAFKELTRPRDP
jgi:TPR repeat protein